MPGKPNRRSFFALLGAAPVAGVAMAASRPTKPIPVRSEPATIDLLQDAHVLMGTLRIGEGLSANNIEFSTRILKDMVLQGPYDSRVRQAAETLAPFYAVVVRREATKNAPLNNVDHGTVAREWDSAFNQALKSHLETIKNAW